MSMLVTIDSVTGGAHIRVAIGNKGETGCLIIMSIIADQGPFEGCHCLKIIIKRVFLTEVNSNL